MSKGACTQAYHSSVQLPWDPPVLTYAIWMAYYAGVRGTIWRQHTVPTVHSIQPQGLHSAYSTQVWHVHRRLLK